MKLAHEVIIDYTTGGVRIDGVTFPYYIAPEPTVEAGSVLSPVNRVAIEILADNVAVIRPDGPQRYLRDGDVETWCAAVINQQVDERLGDVLAWLRGAGVDV